MTTEPSDHLRYSKGGGGLQEPCSEEGLPGQAAKYLLAGEGGRHIALSQRSAPSCTSAVIKEKKAHRISCNSTVLTIMDRE